MSAEGESTAGDGLDEEMARVDRELQTLAAWQVQEVIRALRGGGWDFAAVSIWRKARLSDGRSSVPGASGFEAPRHLGGALPGLADNLRALARELDEAARASGEREWPEGYTHVLRGASVDAARKRVDEHETGPRTHRVIGVTDFRAPCFVNVEPIVGPDFMLRAVLVAGGADDYAAYLGIGPAEWVADHGNKLSFAMASAFFGGLDERRYRP